MAGAVDRIQVHGRAHLGHLGPVGEVLLDRGIGQLGDEAALPVAPDALGEDRVEGGVERGVRHRPDHLGHDRGEVAEGLHRALALVQRPRPVHHGQRQRVAVPVRRDELQRRGDLERRVAAVGLGGVLDELPEEPEQVTGGVELVEEEPHVHVLDGVQLELEGGDDAEVAATPAQRPEQVRVLVLAGGPDLPVGGDHLGGDQVVHREPVAAGQVADAAAEGQSTHAGRGDDPARGRQSVGMGGVVEVPPGGTAAGPGGTGLRVDVHMPHQRQVDHHAVVVGAEPRRAVPTPANREVHAGVAGEVHRRDHVGDLLGADDDLGAPVEHAVVHLPGLLVAGVVGGDHRGSYLLPELVDRRAHLFLRRDLDVPRSCTDLRARPVNRPSNCAPGAVKAAA